MKSTRNIENYRNYNMKPYQLTKNPFFLLGALPSPVTPHQSSLNISTYHGEKVHARKSSKYFPSIQSWLTKASIHHCLMTTQEQRKKNEIESSTRSHKT